MDSIPDRETTRKRLWNDDDVWELAIETFKKDVEYWSHRLPPCLQKRSYYRLPTEVATTSSSPAIIASPVDDEFPSSSSSAGDGNVKDSRSSSSASSSRSDNNDDKPELAATATGRISSPVGGKTVSLVRRPTRSLRRILSKRNKSVASEQEDNNNTFVFWCLLNCRNCWQKDSTTQCFVGQRRYVY